jgi:hypothetical protein
VETVVTVEPDRAAAAAGSPAQSGAPWSLVGLAATVLAAVALLGSVTATAVFASSAASSANQFTTGSLDLAVSSGPPTLSMSSMMPGDSVTAPVTVTNTGTTSLRYAIKSTTTENVLASQLTLTIKSGVARCDNTGFNGAGSVLYGPAVLGSSTGTNVVGDPARGAQAGDRTLAAGTNEVLCMQVTVPAGTGGSYLGVTSTATFDFQAEQTDSNP